MVSVSLFLRPLYYLLRIITFVHDMKPHLLRPADTRCLKRKLVPFNSTTRHSSTSALPRPFRFHVGASWAGKPPDAQHKRLKTISFPKDSPIGKWRDKVLSWPKDRPERHIGEDFFYVQDVCFLIYPRFCSLILITSLLYVIRCATSR